MTAIPATIVVEDDPWTRLIAVVLDPATTSERFAAFADFMSPDEPNFAGWCEGLRSAVGRLFPSNVTLVSSQPELRLSLPAAQGLVVESFTVGRDELAAAPQLRVIHKYGAVLRNIDAGACRAAGVAVHGIRRRANISCAEHAFALMLALARRIPRVNGLISTQRLAAAGFSYRPFDRRHVPGANFGRVPGMRNLSGSTIGIIGLGEIGREIAVRAAAFGMQILYFQRTRLPPEEEKSLHASYRSLESLLAQSDWVIPQVPGGEATLHLLDRKRLAMMKRGACLINISRAEVVERNAAIDALRSGQLGGFALDPLYEVPGRSDDELLAFENVIMTPHMAGSPRLNGLKDIEELIHNLARVLCA